MVPPDDLSQYRGPPVDDAEASAAWQRVWRLLGRDSELMRLAEIEADHPGRLREMIIARERWRWLHSIGTNAAAMMTAGVALAVSLNAMLGQNIWDWLFGSGGGK